MLKVVVCDLMEVDRGALVTAQLERFEAHRAARLGELADASMDPVRLWRVKFADAAIAFLHALS